MHIFVTLPSSRVISLTFKEDDTVTNVKEKVEVREGLTVSEQRLMFAGKQLQDGMTMSSYNIHAEATLHLLLSLRGGSTPSIIFRSGRTMPVDFKRTNIGDIKRETRKEVCSASFAESVSFKTKDYSYKITLDFGRKQVTLEFAGGIGTKEWVGRVSDYNTPEDVYDMFARKYGSEKVKNVSERMKLINMWDADI